MTGKCAHCRRPFISPGGGRPRRYCSPKCRQAAYEQRQKQSVHFSSATPEWSTPADVFADLEREFGPFDLDPCATPDNAKCPRYFTREDNGLAQPWTGRVFMNPPYGRGIGAWVVKAHEAAQTTAELVVCLLPSRTDTRWWHEHAERGDEVRFLRGRLHFNDSAAGAPFPSAVVVFRQAAALTKVAS